jgi:hypothetical protein
VATFLCRALRLRAPAAGDARTSAAQNVTDEEDG